MNTRFWIALAGVVLAQLFGSTHAVAAIYTGSVRGYLEEWLSVTLAVDTQYTIGMTGTSGVAGYAGYYLYDSSKTTSVTSGYAYSTASTASPYALKAGTYWIKVWGNNSSATGTYTITTSEVAAPLANDGASNGSKSTALTAGLGAANTGHIGYLDGNTHNWEDWWKITLPSDGLLALDFVLSGNSDLFLASSGYYLYSVNDRLEDSTTSLASSRTPVNLKAGTYYLRLWVNSSYQYASYSFTPTLSVAPLANDSEQNDSKAAAQNASLNAANTGHIGYDADSHDSEDWWKIILPSDGLLALDFVLSGKSDLFLASSGYYLYSVNDRLEDSTTSLASSRTPVNLKAGTYYLRLWVNSSYQYASYSFTPTLSVAPLANDSEQNDSKAAAQNAALNAANTGHIGYDADSHDSEDWWKITLPGDDTLTLNFETSGTSSLFQASTGYYLYDSNDSVKKSASGLASSGGSVDLKAGTYYLRIWINSSYQYGSYAFTPSLKTNTGTTTTTSTTTTTTTTTTSTTTTTIAPVTTTTSLMGLGAWTVYGTSSLQGGTLTIGDYIGYDTGDADHDGNPYNVWYAGSASAQSGGDYDEAVSVQEFSAPLTLSWTGCFPETSQGYNNIILGRRNPAFTGSANSKQYPISQEFGFSTRWDMPGLNTTVLVNGTADVQRVTSAMATSSGYCSDYRIEWADNLLKFYYDGTKVREQAYPYGGPIGIVVRSFEKPHTFTALSMKTGTSAADTNAKSDCLFDWAESSYSALFSPKAASMSFGPYYLRHYTGTNAYLAVTSGSLVYLGPLSGDQILDLGLASTWYATADCH